MNLSSVSASRRNIESCISNIHQWCASRGLQLNPDKTELIWFGSSSNLAKLKLIDNNITVGPVAINPSESVRDLGVQFDCQLSMRSHVSKTSSVCFYHLRRLRQLRHILSPATRHRLACALILTRIDYCNSVLAGLPATTLAPLQRVMNAAARFVLGLGPRDHITSALAALHWLPVTFRIKFKLCVLMHAIINGNAPTYLDNAVTSISSLPSRSSLRSASAGKYDVPATSTRFGERSFSVAGPRAWNSLPDNIRSTSSLTSSVEKTTKN